MAEKRVLSFDLGTRNLAFALVECPTKVLRMGMIDLRKHAAREATHMLVETLHGENKWMLDAGHDVVIELQPSSGVCKIMGHVIQAVIEASDLGASNLAASDLGASNLAASETFGARQIRFMRAGQKFRFDAEALAASAPESYSDRKQLAVDMARHILAGPENDARYRAFFESWPHKQRTDLADAIVQGCRYLQTR